MTNRGERKCESVFVRFFAEFRIDAKVSFGGLAVSAVFKKSTKKYMRLFYNDFQIIKVI